MTPEEIYERVTDIREEVLKICDAVMELEPTIELCVFVGKLGATLDVLDVLVQAGVPVPEPDEAPHPLERPS